QARPVAASSTCRSRVNAVRSADHREGPLPGAATAIGGLTLGLCCGSPSGCWGATSPPRASVEFHHASTGSTSTSVPISSDPWLVLSDLATDEHGVARILM
ncbi:MAG: hypothetical protein AAF961_18645, partial [Planctomycetota bacterium]